MQKVVEMQQLSSPHRGGSDAKQRDVVLPEGIDHHRSPAVFTVSSLQPYEKADEFINEDQTTPLLKTVNSRLCSVKRIRIVTLVVRYIIVFKAAGVHANCDSSGATEVKPEVPEASDSVAAPPEHHITVYQPVKHSQIENISKIVQQKNLRTLEELGGVDGVAGALGTHSDEGICDQMYIHQQQELYRCLAPTRPFFHTLWDKVKEKHVLLLSLAAVLSIVFEINEEGLENGGRDGMVVIIAIIFQVLVASIHKHWKQQMARKKLRKQQSVEQKEVHVIRGGKNNYICESELVHGDLVLLEKGCQVPGDGLLVGVEDLELKYGSESYIINAQNPFLSYGGRVINGDAKMIVTSTNMMMRKTKCYPNARFKLLTHFEKLNAHMQCIGIIINFLIAFVLFIRYKAGKVDSDNAYRPEIMTEPAGIRSFSNTIEKIIKESRYTLKALTLLSVSLVGLTECVPFIVSIAIVYWNSQTPSVKATAQDSYCILKMASVTKICTDTFGEFTNEANQCIESGIDIITVSSKTLPVLEDLAPQYELTTNDEPQYSSLTGEDFRQLTDEERRKKVGKIRVLGEAFASDKLLLVETLRQMHEVVVFVGQRTDEVPALMAADISIAMGRQSSEKARECSDIIMWDGSFSEITSMVHFGNCIYLNSQSFLQPVLITTMSSGLISLVETAVWGDASLTIVQSVYVNLAVLFLGGLALLTKPLADKPGSMDPVTGGRSLITAHMTRNILVQVLYQVTCLVIIQAKGSRVVVSSSDQDMKTLLSNIFITCQFFNLFNARELQKKNFLRCIHLDKKFWVAITAFVVLHVAFVAVHDVVGYGTRLDWKLWAGCVLFGVLSWLVDWIAKCISWFIMEFVCRFIKSNL